MADETSYRIFNLDDNAPRSCPGAFEEFTCATCGARKYKRVGRPWVNCSQECTRAWAREWERRRFKARQARGYKAPCTIALATERARARPDTVTCIDCKDVIEVKKVGRIPGPLCKGCYQRKHTRDRRAKCKEEVNNQQ